MVRRGPPATRAQPGPAPPRSAPAAGSSSRGTAQRREPSGSGRRAPRHAGIGPGMSPRSAAAPPGVCSAHSGIGPRDRRGHSGHRDRDRPRCHRDPTGISRSTTGTFLGPYWDHSRDRRGHARISLGVTGIPPGSRKGSAGHSGISRGTAGMSSRSALHQQELLRITPGSLPGSAIGSRTIPGSPLGSPGPQQVRPRNSWDLSEIPLGPCQDWLQDLLGTTPGILRISPGADGKSPGPCQDELQDCRDHQGYTWITQGKAGTYAIFQHPTGITPRITEISPGAHQDQQHAQDHTLRSHLDTSTPWHQIPGALPGPISPKNH
ncbi:collagen alpha-1(I) chain-like [Anomalospiza imberbis]|uniref:collagen alpha-1(I) chain-like n=1 Tax=Anomalospiza imberbis TaxID=187417 RepID=UPI00358E27C5